MILLKLCIVLVFSSISLASKERVLLDSANTSIYTVEDIKLLFPRSSRNGKTFSAVLVRHAATHSPPDTETNEFTLRSKDILTWLSLKSPNTVVCFSQDISLPYSVIYARKKGIIPPNTNIISILEDPIDPKQYNSKDDEWIEKLVAVLRNSNHTLFTTIRSKGFYLKALSTGRFVTSREVLLDKINSGIVLGVTSWKKEILHHINTKDHISTRKKPRFRRSDGDSNQTVSIMKPPSTMTSVPSSVASIQTVSTVKPSSTMTSVSSVASSQTVSIIKPSSTMTSVSSSVASSQAIIPSKTSSVTPSSSTISTTTPPPEKKRYTIKLDGDCEEIVSNAKIKEELMTEFSKELARLLEVPVGNIEIERVACGSVDVTFTVMNPTTSTTKTLQDAVGNGLSIKVGGKKYTASKLIVDPKTSTTTDPDKKLAFYLYVSFGAAMGLIFLIGLVVLLRRCHRDQVSRNFSLSPNSDVELRRFNGIPRASYYRVDIYGEPVELDATQTGLNDEYDGDVVPYEQSTFSNVPSFTVEPRQTNNNTSGEEFTMGNLPEWDVPKLKASEVVVNSEKNENSGGIQNDNDIGDCAHAYDNPVMTFGDTTSNE